MARVTPILRPGEYTATADEATNTARKELFDHMFPGQPNPAIPGNHTAFGTVARDPKLALRILQVSDYIVKQMPWTAQRPDLRELAIQALNLHFKCDFSFQAHLGPSRLLGISLEQQACLPFWRTANVFNEEQRLVIEYTLAVVTGKVPEELFARVAKQFGEQEALGCTVTIAWWSLWAMLINATATDFDFGYGKPAA